MKSESSSVNDRKLVSMKLPLKKKDWILILIIFVVADIAYVSHELLKDTAKAVAVVKIDGKIAGTYDLDEDKRIKINNGTNIFEIKNGKVKMVEADCPDQLCVHQRAINASGENIICLPNRVVVQIETKADSEIDAVTN